MDTAIFVYATGGRHPYRDPCRALLESMRSDEVRSEASVETVQEIAHVVARRAGDRTAAARVAALVLSACRMHDFSADDLGRALELFRTHARLEMKDAVHAATALNRGVDVIVTTDRGFDDVPGLRRVDPADSEAVATLTS